MVNYWKRCQALLQWGKIANAENDFAVSDTMGNIIIRHIHRKLQQTDVYFVANVSRNAGTANCSFNVAGKQPELWDPVTGKTRDLPDYKINNNSTTIPLVFDKAQSFFIVFRKPVNANTTGKTNFSTLKQVLAISGAWQVKFDPKWGGPASPVTFTTLQDWTKQNNNGIKYFSGTAAYIKEFDADTLANKRVSALYLDLGSVKHIAHVILNGKDMGIAWTAPWRVEIPEGVLKPKDNKLVIEVTNVWANRLIGDEQEPADCEWLPGSRGGHFLKEFPDWFLNNTPRPSKGRYCFTTWNYFDKDSPLVSSGLLGPVCITEEL